MSNKMLTKKDLNKIFWRSWAYECSYNYGRQQHLGFIWSMTPALKKLYKDQPEEFADACARQCEFYNTTPQIAPWVVGIATALEEENAQSGGKIGNVVSAVKTALMGPISVIGDTLFLTGGFRLIAVTVGAALCIEGNPLGLILYTLIYNIPHIISRYFGIHLGYKMGADFTTKVMGSGILDKVIDVAYIVGITMIGALSASYVSLTTPVAYTYQDQIVSLQGILDAMFRNMLPLGVILLSAWLMRKKNIPAQRLILVLMAIGIIGGVLGIFG